MGPTLVFRAPAASRYAIFFWVSAGMLLLAFALNGGLAEVVRFGAVSLALAAVGWAVFWRPNVRVGPEGVRIANVFRTVTVPWADVEGVETRWGLKVRTTGGRFGAWAAPAAPRPRQRGDSLPDPLLDERAIGTARLAGDARTVGTAIELGLDRRGAGTAGAPAGPGAAPGEHAGADAGPDTARGGVQVHPDLVAIGAVVGSLALAVLTVTALG